MVIMKSVVPFAFVVFGSVLLLASLPGTGCLSSKTKLHPVIIINGLGGSQLQAKLHGKQSPGFLCPKNSKELNIWLDGWTAIELGLKGIVDHVRHNYLENVSESSGRFEYILWLVLEGLSYLLSELGNNIEQCLVDNLKLEYDNITRTTRSVRGVNVNVSDFGDPSTVETLYPVTTGFEFLRKIPFIGKLILGDLELFHHISFSLEKIGLKRNDSIKGAPYDFRRAPNEQKDYFDKLKKLVQETYSKNGNIPVVLIAHSMGAPMTLYFLHQQTQEWKDKYIKSLISLAGAWGGSLKAMKIFIEGDNFGHPNILSQDEFRKFLTTFPSMAWMLPSSQVWGKDEVLVSTSERNYTIQDMEDFFRDLDQPTNGWEMYKDIFNYTVDLGPPGVEVHCLFGNKTKSTLEQLRYKGGLGEGPDHVLGNGDKTVNLKSLEVCRHWENISNKTINYRVFPCQDHLGILKDEEVVQYIEKVVRGEKVD